VLARQESLTHDLVDGIVAPDVLTHRNEVAGLVKAAGGVDAARAVEEILLRSELVG
jgi:hypothetical protein